MHFISVLIAFVLMKYCLHGLILLALDSVYLGTIGKNMFLPMIKDIQGKSVSMKYYAVVLCYLFIIFGLEYFIISQNKSPLDAFVLGVVTYGIYETVNLALFDKWKPLPAIIDTLWGGILFALTVYITYIVRKPVNKILSSIDKKINKLVHFN